MATTSPPGTPAHSSDTASRRPARGLLRGQAVRQRRIAKTILWALCLIPLGRLVYAFLTDGLGANPIETITHQTGRAALFILIATLAVTPVRRISGWNWLVQLRRPLGLFAFFYAILHFATYIVLDQFFAWEYIIEDIAERPYITVGFTALLLLIPLAVTSTRGWIRRLGRNWQRLHMLIYPAAALGLLHFYWKLASKSDVSDALVYGAILFAILTVRAAIALEKRRRRTPRRST